MQNSTLIFIPDISGFTNFVNKTAIEHSRHITSELLEIIINSNNLDLVISEIEGDAVLFYKNDNIPSFEKVFEQAKEMFLNFHTHLKNIEETNVCQCGACRTASNLSLKFITHLGETNEVNVKDFKKLIGSDLILAHRLLKNSIESKEYLLLSNKYCKIHSSENSNLDEWIKIKQNTEEVESFGKVSTKYIDFKPLLKKVSEHSKKTKVKKYNEIPDVFTEINAPILLVHSTLIDANAKYNYVPCIKKIATNDKINRINSSHTCMFDNLEIHFVTKNNTVKKENIIYSEEAEFTNGFSFVTDYSLQERDGKTELSVYFSKSENENNRINSFYGKLKNYIMLKFILRNNKKAIRSFKDYCEKTYKESLK